MTNKQQTGVDELRNIIHDAMFGKSMDTEDDVMAAIQHLLDEREREAYKRGYIAAGVDGLTAERGEVGK